MRFEKLKWEEMTIEEKVSNLKNRIWKFFQKYPHIKEIKDVKMHINKPITAILMNRNFWLSIFL